MRLCLRVSGASCCCNVSYTAGREWRLDAPRPVLWPRGRVAPLGPNLRSQTWDLALPCLPGDPGEVTLLCCASVHLPGKVWLLGLSQ